MTSKRALLWPGVWGLGPALLLAGAAAHAQGAEEQQEEQEAQELVLEGGLYDEVPRTVAEEIPDVEIPDVEIPDVEVPDVRVGGQDAVIEEVPEPAPLAVFDEPAVEPTQPAAEPAAPEATRVTGTVSAIDLDDGTLEVDTDTQGTLRLSIDRARLRQVVPGQSVSLSYVDRSDGRWVSDLQRLAAPEPSPSTE